MSQSPTVEVDERVPDNHPHPVVVVTVGDDDYEAGDRMVFEKPMFSEPFVRPAGVLLGGVSDEIEQALRRNDYRVSPLYRG